MKKKTYVFDEKMLKVLSELREKLGKKEVQIIKEALLHYYDMVKGESLEDRINRLEERIGELERRVETLEEKLSRIKSS